MGESIEKMKIDVEKAKAGGVDVVEIRLDSLSSFDPHQDLTTLIQHHALPLLFTYRFAIPISTFSFSPTLSYYCSALLAAQIIPSMITV